MAGPARIYTSPWPAESVACPGLGQPSPLAGKAVESISGGQPSPRAAQTVDSPTCNQPSQGLTRPWPVQPTENAARYHPSPCKD
jgi:hypothetical protein